MKKAITSLLLPVLLASMPLLVQADDEQSFTVQLKSLNGSGVYGKAEIEMKKGSKLKVSLEANGLEVDKVHPQHIHGVSAVAGNATCPDISADVNADGLISVGEGLPFYGPIVLPLTPFDLVEATGELRYETLFTVNTDSIGALEDRTIVLHGMTVNGEYIASLPIACGEIKFNK